MKFIKPKRTISRVFLHCSDSDIGHHDNIEIIRKWHVTSRGWDDIGYHFFINKLGILQTGRDIEQDPVAQRYHNKGTIAICLSGRNNFAPIQFQRLRKFLEEIDKKYDSKITFHGHCEVSRKTCPNFDYKTIIGINAQNSLTY